MALLTATELKKWRDGLLGTMAPSHDQSACAPACAPRWSRRRSTTSAFRTGDAWEIGLAGLPNAQQARNVILSDDKVREFVAAAYGIDYQFGLLTDTLGNHRRTAEPSRPAPRRGSARSSAAAEADDAEVGQGRRQKPQPEKARALFSADHRAAGSQTESGGQRPGRTMRRCCCKATAARGATIRARAIIAKSTRSSPPSALDPADVTMYCLRHPVLSCGCCCKMCRSGWWRRCTTLSSR